MQCWLLAKGWDNKTIKKLKHQLCVFAIGKVMPFNIFNVKVEYYFLYINYQILLSLFNRLIAWFQKINDIRCSLLVQDSLDISIWSNIPALFQRLLMFTDVFDWFWLDTECNTKSLHVLSEGIHLPAASAIIEHTNDSSSATPTSSDLHFAHVEETNCRN